MQNRYAGDVGDYGKYGMLRTICQYRNIKLGINWYLVPDEGHNNDGMYTSYLKPEKERDFKPCDPELYDVLQAIIHENKRSVREIQDRAILPQNTVFNANPLSFESIGDYARHRNNWHQTALESLKDCDIVFLDPDNGLEVKSYSKTSSSGKKYVFYDELSSYYERGQSLIIYNHRDRKPEEKYIERFQKIREYVNDIGDMFYLRFNRFSVRDYVFVLQPEHEECVRNSVEEMLKGSWAKCYTLSNL